MTDDELTDAIDDLLAHPMEATGGETMTTSDTLYCARCKKELPPPDALVNDGKAIFYLLYLNRTAPGHGMHCHFCPDCGTALWEWMHPTETL